MQGDGEFNTSRERGGVENVGRRERYDTERQRRSCGKSEELEEKKRLREEPPGMCTKQKFKYLASPNTKFYRACCLNTLAATKTLTLTAKDQNCGQKNLKKKQKKNCA